ncbi:hypothetical protein [Streptomyces sp. NPDC013455]|uniref:hypothetical protein n=1 Tax=Streptomyces sp. NPDC013455 TaxID=3155605 RepID=UPI003400CF8C
MPAKSRRASGTGTGPAAGDPHAEVTRAEDGPRAVPPGGLPPAEPGARDEAEVTGDTGKPAVLRGHLGAPDPDSAVVSP